ncbi:MAG: choice-of-anchor tandem repeat GloVer-containing protein, partial [Thermosynechococcaceae cyanobacterium]
SVLPRRPVFNPLLPVDSLPRRGIFFGGCRSCVPWCRSCVPQQAVNGNLYGTTFAGGTKNKGEVFSLSGPRWNGPDKNVISLDVIYKLASGTGPLAAVHSFSGRDGSTPETTLIQPGGNGTALFGTTSAGGVGLPLPKGTVFKFQP